LQKEFYVNWGVDLGSKDDNILNPRNWKGQNLLGIVLMSVRNLLILFEENGRKNF
jgi:predicted NAD-dependent protein-ADP-ribosyltransferase YbiA (DUF1768 family)